ncbi:50S ribosomal protein L10 [Peptoniphilus sp. GNH]|nr:ribosomal protein L10 [Clostridiales bacterium KA00134]UHR03552.1 50S ribosomal protein L10 [Peptoniphilus sp. GNH]
MKEEKLQMKEDLVSEIKGKIEGAKGIVLVNYRGLSVDEVTELRKKFREVNVEYKVYKNTMMRRAFADLGHEGLEEFLVGPSAIAFSLHDEVSAAKVAAEFAKDHEALELKAGFVDGKVVSKAEVEALAKLPAKEVLVAQLLGMLNTPIQGLVNVLQGNLRGLAVVLQAIADQKGEAA